MFIKITRSKIYQYAQLVRSYREHGTSKHEVLLNLGRLDEIENNPSFQRIAFKLTELSNAFMPKISLCNFSEAEIVNWGYLVYHKLWQNYKLNAFFNRSADENKPQFDLSNACFSIILQHLLEPSGKLNSYQNQAQQERYFGLPEIDAAQLYQALDFLGEHKDDLQEHLFATNSNLFSMNNKVFCDSTADFCGKVGVGGRADSIFAENQELNDLRLIDAEKETFDYKPLSAKPLSEHDFDSRISATVLPVADQTESRLEGYTIVLWLGDLLERTLEIELGKTGNEVSAETICKALNSLNFAKIKYDDKLYLIKTKGTDLSKQILQLLKIKSPNNIMPADEFRPKI